MRNSRHLVVDVHALQKLLLLSLRFRMVVSTVRLEEAVSRVQVLDFPFSLAATNPGTLSQNTLLPENSDLPEAPVQTQTTISVFCSPSQRLLCLLAI